MKFSFILIPALWCSMTGQGQDLAKIAAQIVKEAELLYKCQTTSDVAIMWLSKVNVDNALIGGEISYPVGNKLRNIHYSTGSNPQVLATFEFDSTFNADKTTYNPSHRALSPYEKDLLFLKNATYKYMDKHDFMIDKDGNFRLVPIIKGNDRKVYVRYVSTASGTMKFGNDFLVSFGPGTTIKTVKPLHKEASFLNYPEPLSGDKYRNVKYHWHHAGEPDFITANDLCTVRMVGSLSGWQLFVVNSGKYLSIYKPGANTLKIYTAEEMKTLNIDDEL